MMPAARQEQKDRIEQSIALGWTFSRIMRTYGYDYELIKRVWDLMLWEPPQRKPHGTHAAYERHRAAREKVCHRCRVAERTYQEQKYLIRKRALADTQQVAS